MNTKLFRGTLSTAFSAVPSVALILGSGAIAVRGQSALDGFDPNANGAINVIVVQPDGKILIGRDFTTLAPNGGGGHAQSHRALEPDRTLDTAFDDLKLQVNRPGEERLL